ncbi:B12-binding domain-containing radical SAM protein [Thermodesulfobacteriota bacterium]
MNILLVNPRFEPVEAGPGLRSVERAFGIIPPINLLYVASALQKAGADVSILDGEALRITDEQIADRIAVADPDLVGFSATTFSYHQVLAISRTVRKRCNTVTCVGGIHASYYADLIAREDAWDYVAMGEFEPMAEEFVRLLQGEVSPEEVPGIAFMGGAGATVNPPKPPAEDLDSIAFPGRQLLVNDVYFSLLSKWRNFTLMLSSRGCPWQCRFCEHRATPYRMRSAANVLAEMEEANRLFNIREFDFVDSNFCLQHDRVKELALGIDGRYYFSARARVNDLDTDLMKTLASNGCFRLHLGIESASPEVLASLGKEVDLARIPSIMRTAQQLGITIVAYFMIGSPGEKQEQARLTTGFSRNLPFDFVQFTRTTAMPHTDLYREFIERTGTDLWHDYHQKGIMESFPALPDALDPAWVNRFINTAYIRFYLRPGAIIRVVKYFNARQSMRVFRMIVPVLVSWMKELMQSVRK